MARMKTTGNYDFVIQTWLDQEQLEAHTPYVRRGLGGFEGYRMFFKRDTIYSYHDWWPLAQLLPGGRTLFNADTYGVTTSKQSYMVRSALLRKGYRVFETHKIELEPNYLLEEYKAVYERLLRMRNQILSNWSGLNTVIAARKAYREFCREFDFSIEFDLTKEQWAGLAKRYELYYKRREVKRFANKLLTGESI